VKTASNVACRSRDGMFSSQLPSGFWSRRMRSTIRRDFGVGSPTSA
jgi:hypothetical protein